MDSDDDFELLSAEAAPPVRETKLKRLKKAIRVSEEPPVDESESGRVNPSEFEALSLEESNDPPRLGLGSEGLGGEGDSNSGFDGLGGGEVEMSSGSDGLGGGGEIDSGFDCLGGEGEMNSSFDGLGGGEDGNGAKRVLDFDSAGEEFGEEGEDLNKEMPKESGGVRVEETDKKRRGSDGFEEEENKKKKKRAKSKTGAAEGIRTTEKERREHLKQLHAESQRLLRETRDAAFKPIPLVQKPISSVLEKIRKRKLEVSQKCSSTGDYKVLKVATEESIASQAGKGNSANEVCIDGSNDKEEHSSCGNVSSGMDVDEEPKQTFRAPIDYTQDLFSDNQTTSDKDGLPNDDSKSPLEEVFAPSVLAMNLKLDSAPPDDVSSDEEDYNDKENIAPHSSEVADVPSSPIGDPVKAFVDDEAEEEDDSDHDLHRFEDSDDDEDDGDAAELNDMIATGYEERPVDNERRNELHQKWLEQQDASGTEKLMQKLKFGSKQKETELVKEKDADVQEDEEFGEENAEDEEFGNEDADDSAPANAVRMNLRELKQMMPLLYTDNDDVYLSSDDDETEKRLSKQCLSEKAEMQATFLSPAEDESSREVFGHIKKLNIAPDTKKAKVPSFPNMLLAGGDRSISSKSSFLGRGPSHSLPSSNKHGLSTVRSFILVQGDSNSRSSMSEDSSDMVQREILPKKTTAAKLSKSKAKFGTQTLSPDAVSTEAVANTETLAEADAQKDRSAGAGAWADALAVPAPAGSSLLTILRQPSLPSKRCTRGITVDQIESVLASFENGRKSMRANGQVYRRT
ncbi:clumping factor A-like [Pyrus x bretschneideri]|uniref:clumping factor A-like n=1 Tax=Pyrus x bretschneideri TaxID=225117 RepID=UPI00202E8751|nr:clumping factor A-like [Pyrus x bretschneideri]